MGVQEADQSDGIAVPQSDRFRLALRFLAGYGFDGAQATLGLEKQGRVGYAIVGLSGRVTERLSYLVEFNPVSENEPLPACGEPDFFFPNTPQELGPNVRCENDGRVRVDDYRFVALDPLHQQGPVRQAYLDYTHHPLRLRLGRFILPQGFGWEEAVKRPQFSWTLIRGESNVQGGGGNGSIEERAGEGVGGDGGSPEGDRSARRRRGR